MKQYIFLVLIFISGCSGLPTKRTDKLSILQGITNTKEVEFSILAEQKTLKVELRSSDDEILAPLDVKTLSRNFSQHTIHKVIFNRDPKKDYNLYVYEGEKLIDQRLVGRGQKEEDKLKVAVASCMSDFFSDHFKIWDTLAKQNPEYLLLIGDNVYTDVTGPSNIQSTTPEIIWQRYVDIRLTLPLFFQEKLIPVHAVWDDHDYGVNDGNELYPYKKESKEIFDAFYAQDLSVDDWFKGPGVGGLLSLGDFNLYFLDARSFRSAQPTGKHLGLEQSAWLISKMREEATPSLLIKGDQFFGGYHKFESFEKNHPDDFQQFTSELKLLSTPFIFLSGDRHMSEIMQFPRGLFGRPSFEITSSPIHAKMYPESTDANLWRVVMQNKHMNFTIINNEAHDNHWFLDVENIGENGEVYYRKELAVFIKDLQNNLNEVRKRRHGKRRYRRSRR